MAITSDVRSHAPFERDDVLRGDVLHGVVLRGDVLHGDVLHGDVLRESEKGSKCYDIHQVPLRYLHRQDWHITYS